MRSNNKQLISVSFILSCILPNIHAGCYIQESYIDNYYREFQNLECYNTSIDNYIQDLNDLLLLVEQKRKHRIPILHQLTIINSNFSYIEDLTNPIKILRYNFQEEITELALKFSKIKFIKSEAFNDFNNLIKLNLSFNSIENISFIPNLPASLMHLNLTNNRIRNIDFDLFLHTIECLDLSFNKITYLSISSEEGYFPIGKCLYLNNNYIHEIQYNMVNIYRDLLQVNLAYNDIKTIKFNESEHYFRLNLKLLDLSHQSDILDLETVSTTKLNFVFEKLILANNKIQNLMDNITFSSSYYKSVAFANCSLRNTNNFNFYNGYRDSVNFSYNNLKTINKSTFAGSTIETVDLSFNQIENLNSVFENARIGKLNLRSNKMSELNYFAFDEIKWLDLSFNNLKLNNYSFSNCPGLTTLDLSSNNISEFEDLAFNNNLISLKYLNLNNNSIKYLNANMFKALKAIEEISLNNNQLTIIDKNDFSYLPLKTLNINENNIKIIRPYAFYNLSYIRNININYNKQKLSIENKAFSYLPLLRQVYLKDSNINEINFDIFSNVPELAILDIRDNNITSIHFSNYSDKIYLKELYLTFRGEIKTNSFKNLKFLEKLTFLNSEISSINEKAFQGLFNLRNLEFENTKIQSLDFGALDGLFAADNIDLKIVLQGKRILIRNMFRNLYNIRNINFSNRNLENIMPYAFEGLKRLHDLDLSNNRINKLEICTFCGLKQLIILNLSNNKINKIIKCSFCGLNSLHELDLSNNSLVTLNHGDFDGLNNLLRLNLNANGITNMKLGALQNFPTLKQLSIAENNLTEFKVGTFSNLFSLRMLDLQKNSISTLLFESFLPLKSLQYLNLEFNNLKSIEHFSMVSNLSLLRFAINKNKWQCDYLANMLVTFKKHNIDYVSEYLNFLDNNIGGIECIDICEYLLCLKDSHGIN